MNQATKIMMKEDAGVKISLKVNDEILGVFKKYSGEGCRYCGGGEGNTYLPEEKWDSVIESTMQIIIDDLKKKIISVIEAAREFAHDEGDKNGFCGKTYDKLISAVDKYEGNE